MSGSAHAVVKLSVNEFRTYPTPDGKAELVRGELRLTPPPGAGHGAVAAAILKALINHVDDRQLGRVFANSCFELLDLPRTVRAPDIAFVRSERLPAGGLGPGFMRVSPDLAIEVLSPSERRARVREKLEDYRASHVPLVWLIDPRKRSATVIDADGVMSELGETEVLRGGDVVPGFSCRIADLFVGLEPK